MERGASVARGCNVGAYVKGGVNHILGSWCSNKVSVNKRTQKTIQGENIGGNEGSGGRKGMNLKKGK